ncbi:MAG: glycoside hydrolase family 38 C-terminal domain-containing protein, partial [Bacillota bacterium]
MKDKVFHVISNTHWDREWRFPFQKNRQMLVEMIDKTLEILESEPDYRAFHLDSQSIVLDDYLEIRPDKKDLIKKLVKEKRLLIGPWYILPDEFHVGGENLIRNLLLGHKTCEEFGGASKIGYSPFSWGQISQLPQIYKEFGVDVIMFYRGVNSLDSKKAEFMWEGADGTKVLTSRFSTMPRYNFYFYIYRPVIHNEGFSDVEYKWTKGGLPFHFADSQMHDEDYSIIEPVDGYYEDNITSSVKSIIENQVNDFTTPHVIWMEGHDSSGPNIKTAKIIKDIRRLMPELNVVHSTLEDYAKGLKESADEKTLRLVKGERRSAQYDLRSGNLYGYITSARTYLKQKNFESEKWLQSYAEVLNSIAGIFGMDINDRYLDVAWNYLIQNSAHDSIGGCSLDEIHDDMMSRYKQVIEISKGVTGRACKYLAKQIDLSKYAEASMHLVALNTTSYKREEVAESFIDIPEELDKGDIEVKSGDGKTVPLQLISRSSQEPVLEQMIDRPMYFKMKRYHAYLHLDGIPSFGFNTFHINPVAKAVKQNTRKIAKLNGGFPVLENDYLKIKINENGTLKVQDKINGLKFNNTGYFLDEGEAGHAWVHKKIAPVADTLSSKPQVSIIENGELSATCLIRHEILVHKDLEEREKKNGKKIKIPIELYVTLKKATKYIGFDIKLNNLAESHRMRFMIPTGIKANSSFAEGQFDVVERSIERIDSTGWVEQPMYDYPMYHFVDVSDKLNAGAAVFVQGLTEYEVLEDKVRTLAITLFRGFKYIIAPSSVQDYSHKKGSQVLGEHSY